MPDIHRDAAIDLQEDDPDSVLQFTRKLLRWRRTVPMLRTAAEHVFEDTPSKIIAFERERAGESLICAVNFNLDPIEVTLPRSSLKAQFSSGGFALQEDKLTLDGLAAVALT